MAVLEEILLPNPKSHNRGTSPNDEKVFVKKSRSTPIVKTKVMTANPDKSVCRKRKRLTQLSKPPNLEVTSLMERAREVQANLGNQFPSMIKLMHPSHISGGFWLGLAKSFCGVYMPKEDTMVTLQDENGEEFQAKYLIEKVGLSGGWRRFSMVHKLVEHDVLVFHLIERFKFKVYILKSSRSDEVDGALNLLKLEACYYKPTENDTQISDMEDDSLVPLLLKMSEEDNGHKKSPVVGSGTGHVSDQSENESNDLGCILLDGLQLSESPVKFQEVKSLEDFSVRVNGLIINSMLSKHILTKYYDLCCSQKIFLHDNLLEGLNCTLVTGIISETVNIADAIKYAKTSTSQENFDVWDKTLRAFQALGMEVEFLIFRLEKLLNLVSKSKHKRLKEAECERDKVQAEKEILKAEILKLDETIDALNHEIKTLDNDSDDVETMFQMIASAPW